MLQRLRELRAGIEGRMRQIDRKLDAVLEELHDMRAEAAADRGRTASVDNALQARQRRLQRTDERLGNLAKKVEQLKAAGG